MMRFMWGWMWFEGCGAEWVTGFWVYIRCCGNGDLWFRPYGESPFTNAGVPAQQKGNPKRSPLTYGSSPRLGVPSLWHSSGGIALRLASLAPTCDESDCVERRGAPIPG